MRVLQLSLVFPVLSFCAARPLTPEPILQHRRSASLPISRRVGMQKRVRRDGASGAIGLGDDVDLSYTVSIQLGGITTPVNLDTGSSDLWVISDACNTAVCGQASAPRYPLATFAASGAAVALEYGDSTSGTHASGPVGQDTAVLAGLVMDGQYFAAVNDTDNTSVEDGAAGIFGLSFPSESQIQEAVVSAESTAPGTDAFVSATSTAGPLLSRMAMAGTLEQPMFTITLQRDTIAPGSGNHGQLTVGALPAGIDNASLTWVPVRLYAQQDGGLAPPSFARNEIYPLRWEVPLDAVLLDGVELPSSTIPSATKELSALIDTGNSIIRGPADVVSSIVATIAPSSGSNADSTASPALYPCATPHTLAFQIGGAQFPVDPRDYASPTTTGNGAIGETCDAGGNLVSTDPPSSGALFSWSLGDTFLKSTLVAFYYGNLTHPSTDPPRMGFLSTVPSDAGAQLVQAAQAGAFSDTSEPAPTAPLASDAPPAATTLSGVGANQAQTAPGAPAQPTGATAQSSGAIHSLSGSRTGRIAATAVTFAIAYWLF